MPFLPIDHGVTEEEPAKEPEDPYREQEAAAADRTKAKASFIDPYVSSCIHVRTFSCSLGLGSITYTST